MMSASQPPIVGRLSWLAALFAGVCAVACAAVGESWLYEHAERPLARTLCGGSASRGECFLTSGPEPSNVGPLLVLAVVAAGVAGLAAWRLRRVGALPYAVFLALSLLIAAMAVAVTAKRTHWLSGRDSPAICLGYPGSRPGSNVCAPLEPPSDSAWLWLAAAGVCAAVATFLFVRAYRLSRYDGVDDGGRR